MARPIDFDKDEALHKAMMLFSEKGYRACSIQDLLDAMEIQRGSLYAAFGSKRDLYRRVLDRYENLFIDRITEFLVSSDQPLQRIRDFFDLTFLGLSTAQLKTGCLLVNTLVEMTDLDQELVDMAGRKLIRVESAMREALIKARQLGQLGSDQDPAPLAAFLGMTIKGLRITCKENQDKERLRDIIDIALSAIGA